MADGKVVAVRLREPELRQLETLARRLGMTNAEVIKMALSELTKQLLYNKPGGE